jgi:RND family efflux transporter MFP subunit
VTGTISGPFFGAITNHLWQSTIFALAAALLTLTCRKNRAQVRYWLWLSASLKFLIPFAPLMSLGSTVWKASAAPRIAPDFFGPISRGMMQAARPFADMSLPSATGDTTGWLAITVLAIWAAGSGAIVLMRLRDWLGVRAAVRAGTPIDIGASVEVRSSPDLLEPGVIGFFRCVLLLPEGILERLTPPQLKAIVAHELSHIRRRDNLTAALHMLVETVFWFYPLVWWIGARLLQERERACDEAVLGLGNEPGAYADAILNVCKLYVESPLACVAGVTGASLNSRIQAILTQRLAAELPYGKKMSLLVIGLAAVAAPVMLGMVNAPLAQAQSASSAFARVQHVRGAKLYRPRPDLDTLFGTVAANSVVVVSPRVDGQLISVNFKEGGLVQKGQILASIDAQPYRPQLAAAQGQLARDEARLAAAAAQGSQEQQQRAVAQLRAVIEADQARIETAERQLSYAEVAAPITGIAGFRQVDVGNIVHAGDRLVVINQLQPVAVLFNIQQDYLPKVLARLRAGTNPTVVLFNRADITQKLATGRLVAADNQIDQQSGTVTLKATFDNKDGELFPGQFVIVRLLLNAQ